ncbi:hypothetical protein Syun_018420 [Stephania yunnanensis]|uniref:Uncharacterized protein n=1 Tax=Stephania yunnanensis TaxID=152371 RepID=A0AAP0NVT7_9MAGN
MVFTNHFLPPNPFSPPSKPIFTSKPFSLPNPFSPPSKPIFTAKPPPPSETRRTAAAP